MGIKTFLSKTNKISLFFSTLMIATSLFFIVWGLHHTEYNHTLVFFLATAFGLFMAFNIGGNDVANSFGTSVGAGTLSITQALCVAAIFEVSGAIIAGGEVTDTIRKGIVDISSMQSQMEPMQFIYIMMSALFAAAFWLLFATRKGLPVSTTHAIIGGIVGAAMIMGASLDGVSTLSLVKWHKIGQIVMSWFISPILGGAASYALFSLIKKYILDFNTQAEEISKEFKKTKKLLRKEEKARFQALSDKAQIDHTHALASDADIMQEGDYDLDDLQTQYYRELHTLNLKRAAFNTHAALQNWIPFLAALGATIITAMLLFKGLKHVHLGITTLHNYLIMAMVGAAIWMATFIYTRTLKKIKLEKATFLIFSWMQVFTAAGFAFSHGSNDIANAVGPFAAILDTLKYNTMSAKAPLPTVVMFAFGISLIVGLWFIGRNVIATVGTHLTKMHPSSGFAAELSAASVVMIASTLGLPVSSTHILVGAVLGIGLVNKNANWKLMKPIAMSWVLTVPAAAILAVIAFLILNLLL